MIKNLILLAALSWVSYSYAKSPKVAKESFGESEKFKVESPVEEQDAQRSVAGDKLKKKKLKKKEDNFELKPTESDPEVRYWQYSE